MRAENRTGRNTVTTGNVEKKEGSKGNQQGVALLRGGLRQLPQEGNTHTWAAAWVNHKGHRSWQQGQSPSVRALCWGSKSGARLLCIEAGGEHEELQPLKHLLP